MGDLGREVQQVRDDPQPIHPTTELDELEGRLSAFFDWAHGRSHQEIRDRYAADFAADPLDDDIVGVIGEGRGSEVRARLPHAAG